jgi:hypothetical protein
MFVLQIWLDKIRRAFSEAYSAPRHIIVAEDIETERLYSEDLSGPDVPGTLYSLRALSDFPSRPSIRMPVS